MAKNDDEQLTGDAAYRAEKAAISKRNDAAHARAQREREARHAEHVARERAADAREWASLPTQPNSSM